MRPTVSVIVPCFNAEKTVVRTLDSLVQQTLVNLEIIIINDGSTDHTKDIIENYITDHKEINICLYTKENEGIASARNYALTKVHGEYFGFLDSDDYAEKEMFEDLYQLAKKDNQRNLTMAAVFGSKTNEEQKTIADAFSHVVLNPERDIEAELRGKVNLTDEEIYVINMSVLKCRQNIEAEIETDEEVERD